MGVVSQCAKTERVVQERKERGEGGRQVLGLVLLKLFVFFLRRQLKISSVVGVKGVH